MKYIPVDQYVSERHFEDCVVPQGVCLVDYSEQYQGDEEVPAHSVVDNKTKLERRISMTKELHTRICVNCGNKSHEFCEPLSQYSMKTILREYCGLCSKRKGHYTSFWWGDGTPIGHVKQLTPEQSKYIVEDK